MPHGEDWDYISQLECQEYEDAERERQRTLIQEQETKIKELEKKLSETALQPIKEDKMSDGLNDSAEQHRGMSKEAVYAYLDTLSIEEVEEIIAEKRRRREQKEKFDKAQEALDFLKNNLECCISDVKPQYGDPIECLHCALRGGRVAFMGHTVLHY